MTARARILGIRAMSRRAAAISPDGRIAAGSTMFGDRMTWNDKRLACWWTERDGMRLLQEVLENEAWLVFLGDWTLTYANDITEDGRYIVGEGKNADGEVEAWLVFLGDWDPLAD